MFWGCQETVSELLAREWYPDAVRTHSARMQIRVPAYQTNHNMLEDKLTKTNRHRIIAASATPGVCGRFCEDCNPEHPLAASWVTPPLCFRLGR